MIQSVGEQYQAEVKKGERFQFGKNWAKFLTTLTDEKISQAERSLQNALAETRLDGKTFLDVGSGSGLFSLAACRLGAAVHSFDYDPNSVACTKELKRRFFPTNNNWIVEQGSVLDCTYLAKLGIFDIVYSWGVLHHTGQMWAALDNVKPMVRQGGQLYISIYNDLGAATDRWRAVKRIYNRLPAFLQFPFALSIITSSEARTIIYYVRNQNLKDYFRQWTKYDSIRGMSKWYDWIDWIGGYPYECASMESLVDFFSKDGFALEWSLSRANGTGCNETVFRREADFGAFIDNLVPKSRFLLRRCGRRVNGPFYATAKGYVANMPNALSKMTAESFVLFQDGKLVGTALPGEEPGTLIVAQPDCPEQRVLTAKFEIVLGKCYKIDPPFREYAGHMFGTSLEDLTHLADNTTPSQDTSPVFFYEDKQQLGFPHSLHADIIKFGGGRFSHWGQELLFSTSDASDPRTNGRKYDIVIADFELI
jgi:2-polyprenyl-3-methyl-5-hydroxy-6-metoxy-1,4-benzoquinol methylase